MDNKEKETECVECNSCGEGEANEERDIIFLTLDDDTEVECSVLGIFDAGDKEYIALLPKDEDEAIVYEYVETDEEENSFDLVSIEDEDEFELVSKAYYELFSEEEEEE